MVFFRFNCGGMWGMGHLYRNLLLMEKLRDEGEICTAIINNNAAIAEKILSQKNFDIISVSKENESSHELIEAIMNYASGNHLIFIDRLDTDDNYIDSLKKAQNIVITYDDYDKSALLADVPIITRNVRIDGKSIKCAGPKYQLLREDVEKYAAREKVIEPLGKKVLLSFGGTDPLGLLDKMFTAIQDLDEFEFEFIAGIGQNDTLCKLIQSCPNMAFCQGVNDFARRVFKADLCIVAGGVTMYEVAAIGTPMINISHNEDQNFAASIFASEVGSINLGIGDQVNKDIVVANVVSILRNYNQRVTMSKCMKEFVPGGGTDLICKMIKTLLNGGAI